MLVAVCGRYVKGVQTGAEGRGGLQEGSDVFTICRSGQPAVEAVVSHYRAGCVNCSNLRERSEAGKVMSIWLPLYVVPLLARSWRIWRHQTLLLLPLLRVVGMRWVRTPCFFILERAMKGLTLVTEGFGGRPTCSLGNRRCGNKLFPPRFLSDDRLPRLHLTWQTPSSSISLVRF